jgi:hypothetical protein
LAAKAAGNESVNGCMTAYNDKSRGGKQCNNQPTMGEEKASGGGGGNGDSNGSGGG